MEKKPDRVSIYEVPVGIRKVIRTADGYVKDIVVCDIKTPVVADKVVDTSVPDRHLRLHDITSALDHAPADAGDYNKLVATNPTTGAVEFIAKDTVTHARAHAITSLLDHIAATGLDMGKFIRSNPTTGAIEFTDIATTFLALTDVIATTYATKAKYVPMVTDTANSMDLTPTEELVTALATFVLLADVPSNYAGMGGKTVKVKMDESGLEFV